MMRPAIETVRLIEQESARASRPWHIVLLVSASLALILVLTLWLTEQGLPLRTHLAFAALSCVGTAWVGHAAFVLLRRTFLAVPHQHRAAGIALAATGLFLAFAAMVWLQTRTPGPLLAAGVAAVLMGAAWLLYKRSEQRWARLSARCTELTARLERR